jgi:hypothetical protein
LGGIEILYKKKRLSYRKESLCIDAGNRGLVSGKEVLYMIHMYHLFLIHVGSGFG